MALGTHKHISYHSEVPISSSEVAAVLDCLESHLVHIF